MTDLTRAATAALRASIRFSGEVVGIAELNPALLSALNRTMTVRNLRKDVETMAAFVEALERTEERQP